MAFIEQNLIFWNCVYINSQLSHTEISIFTLFTLKYNKLFLIIYVEGIYQIITIITLLFLYCRHMSDHSHCNGGLLGTIRNPLDTRSSSHSNNKLCSQSRTSLAQGNCPVPQVS